MVLESVRLLQNVFKHAGFRNKSCEMGNLFEVYRAFDHERDRDESFSSANQ